MNFAEGLGLLGLARRSGHVAPGTARAREAIRRGDARLVLVAADASPAQVDKVRKPAERRGIPLWIGGSRAAFGRAVGTGPVSAVAVTRADLAAAVLAQVAPRDEQADVER
ncbi:MAG: ribosomal L7Ae/L30e/S12e/Gadd45 family protein [Gemmatimonadetes bacterium]|nr:ribosomal L7Ae/L30e/S12e/Gadd45 family protein [Gemmatimonadota bacterium]